MPMQQDADTTDYPATEDGGAGECMPCPTGPGGNTMVINSNEAEIIEAAYEDMSIDQVGRADDFSSVQGIFQMPGL